MFGILSILLVSTFAIGITLILTTGSLWISHGNTHACSCEIAEQLRIMKRDITTLKEHNEKLEGEIRNLRIERDQKQTAVQGIKFTLTNCLIYLIEGIHPKFENSRLGFIESFMRYNGRCNIPRAA